MRRATDDLTHPRSPTTRRRGAVALLLLLAVLGFVAGCGSDSGSTGATSPAATEATSSATGTVTVFAAASLTGAFEEAAEAFEEANPDAEVTINFAASSALAQQINEGAPADVFASADQANMQKAVDAGSIAGEPEVFATNDLQIIVEPGNPKGITGVADLAKSGVVYVTAAPEVPIGKYAAQVLEKAGVTATPSSLEADVRAVVTKVTSGEADAGIVYVTDVAAAGAKAQGVDIPADLNVVASYPVAVTEEAANPEAAAAWIAFITGIDGQTILAKYGFGSP
ncbi:MAG TPA: molybdate ABC transporter substrate-binding protein [Acidimicrobiales bacterium]